MNLEGWSSGAVFAASTASLGELDVDLLCVPVFQGEDRLEDVEVLDEAARGEIARARSSGEFRGKAGTLFVTPAGGNGWKPRRIALVGAGRRADYDAERQRHVAAVCSHAARKLYSGSVAFVVRPGDDALTGARMAADGLSAAEFLASTYKRDDELLGPFPGRVIIRGTGVSGDELEAAVRYGRTIGESANFARALANEPPNVLTPREFARQVAGEAEQAGLSVEVLDEERLRELGMRLLLAVGQGSAEPPRLVVLRYEPAGAPPSPVLGFVGKGVTFDTGGISIKPAEGMDRMKYDMSGGAAVAGAMRALAGLGAPVRVIGLIPMTENMPGGRATRPGDVLTAANGRTVEITNTDAEGRLILADALWWATQLNATHLVDVATLTGACMVALGRHVSGVMGAPVEWVTAVQTAAARAGDRVWPLPIYREVKDELRSEIADMVNAAGRPGGAITAAAFLREFTSGLPWAHLDVAGTAWADHADPHQPKGPTGVAVRVLTELAMTAGPALTD